LGAVDSLATPSGDERVFKSSDVAETTDDGTTSGEQNLAAAVAVVGVGVSEGQNLPVLPLCTGLRTLSALRNTVISYARYTIQQVFIRHLIVHVSNYDISVSVAWWLDASPSCTLQHTYLFHMPTQLI